jgi:predicted DsbA family dithiol-disulfide isomerase
METPADTVFVHVWTDVVCPFCYLGEEHLKQAVAAFEEGSVVVVPHSFRLTPELVVAPGASVYSTLAATKGISEGESRAMHASVAERAAAAGLQFNFDRAVPANTTRAHQMLQQALPLSFAPHLLHRLFSAYFTEGQNIDDPAFLARLWNELAPPGALPADATGAAAGLAADERLAAQLGIHAVPHFVITRSPDSPAVLTPKNSVAVRGAQPPSVLLRALERE